MNGSSSEVYLMAIARVCRDVPSADQRDEEHDKGSATAEIDAPSRLVLGLKGGFVATVVMTVFRHPISKSLPPTAQFWAKYVGDGDPKEYTFQAVILHVIYGVMASGICALIWTPSDDQSTIVRESTRLLWGVVYSVLLSVFGTRVILKRVLDMKLEPDEALIFYVGHVIYGLTMGAYIGSTPDSWSNDEGFANGFH